MWMPGDIRSNGVHSDFRTLALNTLPTNEKKTQVYMFATLIKVNNRIYCLPNTQEIIAEVAIKSS